MLKLAWNWRDEALDIHWSLTNEERTLLINKPPRGRLGFAVLLKYFQNEGRFPEQISDAPSVVLVYLANQLNTDRSDLEYYALNSRMSLHHGVKSRYGASRIHLGTFYTE